MLIKFQKKGHCGIGWHMSNVLQCRYQILREMFPKTKAAGEDVATLSNSKSEEPLLVSRASNKRKNQDQLSDEADTNGETPPPKKRSQPQNMDAGLVINMVTRELKATREVPETRQKEIGQEKEGQAAANAQIPLDHLDAAGDILLQHYQNRLTPKQLAIAFDRIIYIEAKARAFAKLPKGEARDRFLEIAIGGQLLQSFCFAYVFLFYGLLAVLGMFVEKSRVEDKCICLVFEKNTMLFTFESINCAPR